MSLRNFKKYMDKELGFDISTNKRYRKYSYSRKVFSKIGRDAGFTYDSIGDILGISHEVVMFHYKTFDGIYFKYKIIHNDIIDVFGLDIEKVPTEPQKEYTINSNLVEKLDYAKSLLSVLEESDLDDFIKLRIQPFLKMKKSA